MSVLLSSINVSLDDNDGDDDDDRLLQVTLTCPRDRWRRKRTKRLVKHATSEGGWYVTLPVCKDYCPLSRDCMIYDQLLWVTTGRGVVVGRLIV